MTARLVSPLDRCPVWQPGPATLMLARDAAQPFSRAGWIFEAKYDGVRATVETVSDGVCIRSRSGRNITANFPEVAESLAALPSGVVLDGELVVLDEVGRSEFSRVQRRLPVARVSDVSARRVSHPACFAVFDALSVTGRDVRRLALLQRKSMVGALVSGLPSVLPVSHIDTDGAAAFDWAVRMGLEGVMAKDANAPYISGRSDAWLKVKVWRSDDFLVVGIRPGRGGRGAVGSLVLATTAGGALRHAGEVGSGLHGDMLGTLRDAMALLRVESCPLPTVPDDCRDATWVRPLLVCEVRYAGWGQNKTLRHPSFRSLRVATA